MNRKAAMVGGVLGLLAMLLGAPSAALAGARTFAYVSKNYIITAEAAGAHEFVVNCINLSDYVVVIQPSEFIYRASSGRHYIGQVFRSELMDARGERQRYTASFLLKARTFAGLTIVGVFQEQDRIEAMSLRIGAKRFFLQPMEPSAFEQLAKKIGDLDLDSADSAGMLAAANIAEMGTVRTADGSPEWDQDWQGLFTEGGINPPKFLQRPDIEPTPEARKSRTYGKIRLSGTINKNGGIQNLRVVKGLGKGLDERAIEGIQNSWLFLPATQNGEVFETQITIEVEFPDPGKK